MSEWVERRSHRADHPGASRRARTGGIYRTYLPDLLHSRRIDVPASLSHKASRVEQLILALSNRGPLHRTGPGLEGISRFLLRSEAISSSRIEGIAPQPDKVAIAELRSEPGAPSVPSVAQRVANNIALLQQLSEKLRRAETVGLAEIVESQEFFLDNPRTSGIREIQNWIGGFDYSPLKAEFVPPPPELVPELMDDVIEYLNGATHGALIQAALVHAQFEAIHPFADGNGRIGRALIHVVLQRRGLVNYPVIPVSMVLGAWSDRYVHGLTRFRENDPDGLQEWLDIFISATEEATTQAARLSQEINDLRAEWRQRVDAHRKARGMTRALRSDSVQASILENIPDHPLLTAPAAAAMFSTSRTAATNALEDLVDAGVLRRRPVGKGITGFLADEVFHLITLAERRLASTRFDTAHAPLSVRAVTNLPDPPSGPVL